MKNYKGIIILISFFLLCSAGNDLFAQDASGKKPATVLSVKIKGYNVCLGCLLAKNGKAFHQVDKYGHQPILHVKKAVDEKGTNLSKIEGSYLHYLLNDNSYGLFAPEVLNKPIILKGRFFVAQRTIDVTSFKIADHKTTAGGKTSEGQSPSINVEADDPTITGYDSETSNPSDSDKPWYYDRVKALKDSSQ